MSPKTIHAIAKPLRKKIGAHGRMPLQSSPDAYFRAQSDSDVAVQQAKYLIQHLANRHDAVQFAHAVGMPSYVNMR